MKNPWASPHRPLRSPSLANLHVRKPLTDHQIERYQKLGYYSAEVRAARRAKSSLRRDGNWLITLTGDAIYSP